ncbi:MAG: helix-turn-helix domain-containing protein [Hyphomicrobiales bacterium]|nr:helix-turn-helix domain-containing protein [Hyphomicrobiales bacterium]
MVTGDLLYGVRAIAAHLGLRDRQALHLVESGKLPHFRLGKKICARRSSLAAWIVEHEAAGGH